MSQDSVIHYVKGKGDDANYDWTSAHCSTRHLHLERRRERKKLLNRTYLTIHPRDHITPRSTLYRNYESETFLWFTVELIRSMLIVAIRVLASNWPPVQVTIAILVRKIGTRPDFLRYYVVVLV